MHPIPPASAELQVSNDTTSSSTWFSRGFLPHRDEAGLVQFLTFRLADALPREALLQIEEQLALLPASTRELERRKRLENWLDAGMGCCALRHARMAETMENALLRFDGTRYRLLAWCIMPNHVHALIQPQRRVSTIVQSWKAFTGRWALAKNAELEFGIPKGAFWMREYWDRYVRNETHLGQVLDYIHLNPVAAGLCARPDHWHWSSARRR